MTTCLMSIQCSFVQQKITLKSRIYIHNHNINCPALQFFRRNTSSRSFYRLSILRASPTIYSANGSQRQLPLARVTEVFTELPHSKDLICTFQHLSWDISAGLSSCFFITGKRDCPDVWSIVCMHICMLYPIQMK